MDSENIFSTRIGGPSWYVTTSPTINKTSPLTQRTSRRNQGNPPTSPPPNPTNQPNHASRVSVSPECIQAFNELKLGKSTKWIIYKISDDWKEIVVEESSSDPDYAKFREKLLSAKSKNKAGVEGVGGRYAVFDVEYETAAGEGKRSKITFISWVPDDAPQYVSPPYPTYPHPNVMMGWCGLLTLDVAADDVLLLERRAEAGPQRPGGRYPGQRPGRHRARQRGAAGVQGPLGVRSHHRCCCCCCEAFSGESCAAAYPCACDGGC